MHEDVNNIVNEEAPLIKERVEMDEKTEALLSQFQIMMRNSNIDPEMITAYIMMVQQMNLTPEQFESLTSEDIQALWESRQNDLEERKRAAREKLEALKQEDAVRRGVSAHMEIHDEALNLKDEELTPEKWKEINRDLNIMVHQEVRNEVQERMKQAQKDEPELYLNREQRRARAKQMRRG